MTEPSGPLAGLLVADFSRVLAGPYATMLLADLGADVIKVESPAGDDTRHWTPPERDGVATYYLSVNRNKHSVALDLTAPGDAALARTLAARADVLVQNFKPGGLTRYGLDHAAVSAANPSIIYASISGFGPGSALPGYDLLVQAVSGLMSVTGQPDGPPTRAGISVVDVLAGLHTTVGVLAALTHRAATGQGQHVTVDLLSSALSGLVNQSGAVVAGGAAPTRMGTAHPSLYPYEALPAADRDIIIAVGNDTQFHRLCHALDAAPLADDPRFTRNAGRTTNRDALRPLLIDRLRTRTAARWFTILSAAGVPCGPINTIAEGIAAATDLGLDPVALAGDIPTIRNPVGLSRSPASYRLPPPSHDEHGKALRTWLSTLR